MLRNDIRYALRLMRRSPGFTAVAVLSLALGIGANTAIYSLFYTVMLRQLPVAHPEQLVELVRNSPSELHWAGYWGWEKYEYLRDHNHVFSGITGMGVRQSGPGAHSRFRSGNVDPGDCTGELLSGARVEAGDRAVLSPRGCPGKRGRRRGGGELVVLGPAVPSRSGDSREEDFLQ